MKRNAPHTGIAVALLHLEWLFSFSYRAFGTYLFIKAPVDRQLSIKTHYPLMETMQIVFGLIILLSGIPGFAQPSNVSVVVSFDSYVSSADNDYVNNFTVSGSPNPFTQVTTGGITGGAIASQISSDQGTFARFKYSFANVTNRVLNVSVDFTFQESLVPPGSFERAVTVMLAPDADYNHNVMFGVGPYLDNRRALSIMTYSDTGEGVVGVLTNGWYRLVTTITNMGGTPILLSITSELFSLGSSGTAIPASVGVAGLTSCLQIHRRPDGTTLPPCLSRRRSPARCRSCRRFARRWHKTARSPATGHSN